MSSKTILRKIPTNFERTFISDSSAALARSHRLIRVEQEKETVFMCICSQIHLDDFRKSRSEKQRENRRQKREKIKVTEFFY
jgi:hypothetical protein